MQAPLQKKIKSLEHPHPDLSRIALAIIFLTTEPAENAEYLSNHPHLNPLPSRERTYFLIYSLPL